MTDHAALDALRGRIGHRFIWRGEPVRLRDLSSGRGVVVIEHLDRLEVQGTAYGDAHRRVPALTEIDLVRQPECLSELQRALDASHG